jgi:chemotaxis protein CheD
MSRRPVQFGLGDLETRLSGLLTAEEAPLEGDAPPAGIATFVHTGEVAAARSSTLFSTILGSCVSVCLWDPTTGAGGMNHFLLPDQVSNGLSTARFGNVAVKTLLVKLDAFGVPVQSLRAKIFGGASVLDNGVAPREVLGARNIELARVLLTLAGIPVVAEDVGGTRGRKLIFRTSDGAAWVRKL